MPFKAEPEVNRVYWAVFIGDSKMVQQLKWQRDGIDLRLFERGLCFATREDAEANLRAMLAREEE